MSRNHSQSDRVADSQRVGRDPARSPQLNVINSSTEDDPWGQSTGLSSRMSSVRQSSARDTMIAPSPTSGDKLLLTPGSDVGSNVAPADSDSPMDVPMDDKPIQAAEQNGRAPKTQAQVYYDQLCIERRGSPLWVPGPDLRLPTEYRRKGVGIGDVGIINAHGAFSFLFNIFYPADHPINLGNVPDIYSPLEFEAIEADVEEYTCYSRDAYVPSVSVRRSNTTDSSDLEFETTASEGAILTMPKGASSIDLSDTSSLEGYVRHHAASWYRYAIQRGRHVKNGNIRLVVGCDKVSSWGLATFLGGREQGSRVAFSVFEGQHSLITSCHGSADAKTGPSDSQLRGLGAWGVPSSAIENQCVFLRSLNPSFSEAVWNEIVVSGEANRRTVDSGDGAVDSSEVDGPHNTSIVHPATALNNVLLRKYPRVRMVITNDEDWTSVITQDHSGLPDPEQIGAQLADSRELHEIEGCLVIKRPLKHKRRSWRPNIRIDVQAPIKDHRSLSTSLETSQFKLPRQDRESLPGAQHEISFQNQGVGHQQGNPDHFYPLHQSTLMPDNTALASPHLPHPLPVSTLVDRPLRKRGKLPKKTTDCLKKWIHSHSNNPYPSDEEKRHLCLTTGLNMSQLCNWMINARRRILTPAHRLSAASRQSPPLHDKTVSDTDSFQLYHPSYSSEMSQRTVTESSSSSYHLDGEHSSRHSSRYMAVHTHDSEGLGPTQSAHYVPSSIPLSASSSHSSNLVSSHSPHHHSQEHRNMSPSLLPSPRSTLGQLLHRDPSPGAHSPSGSDVLDHARH